MSKIRGDIPSDNKRLRLNNLKKVANAIEEYNSEIMGLHYSSGFVQPDLTKAAEGNRQDMGTCLRLILMVQNEKCIKPPVGQIFVI